MLVPLKNIPKDKWNDWYFSMPVSEIATALRVKKETVRKHLKRYNIIKPGTARKQSKPNLWAKEKK